MAMLIAIYTLTQHRSIEQIKSLNSGGSGIRVATTSATYWPRYFEVQPNL